MEDIIRKIIKPTPEIHRKISAIIFSDQSEASKIVQIDALIPFQLRRPFAPDRQEFISDRLCRYFSNHSFSSIVDIGGGNGNVLANIGLHFGLPPSRLICVENRQHEFVYPFDLGHQISYVFHEDNLHAHWEPANTVGLVICMVSLHHMSDTTLNQTLYQIHTILEPGGLLLIKEHDCVSSEEKHRIDWEHHLYHIRETKTRHSLDTAQQYLDTFIGNYKSKSWFEQRLQSIGFRLLETFNNVFEQPQVWKNNPSKLFWQIYQKI